jgi:hypothetical protein
MSANDWWKQENIRILTFLEERDEDDGLKYHGILDVMVCHRFNLPCHSLFYIYHTSVTESQ